MIYNYQYDDQYKNVCLYDTLKINSVRFKIQLISDNRSSTLHFDLYCAD